MVNSSYYTGRKPHVLRRKAAALMMALLGVFIGACQKSPPAADESTDVVLIGGGIMSATLGSLLMDFDPDLHIQVFEKLNDVALESSSAWKNAGTGHAAYAELNYTPSISDNEVDIKKAIHVNAGFEISKEYWAYLVENKKIADPRSFINDVPHMSFVWGDKNVAFLKTRYNAMIKHPYFSGMEFSEDHEQLKKWFPLIMEGRDPHQKVAATRMVGGTDVDFGTLTRNLFANLLKSKNNQVYLQHEVVDIKRNKDASWKVTVKNLNDKSTKIVNAKFVFIGAGGGALALLQKSGIEEANGFGGFPVGGAWLVTDNEELIHRHYGKVYGQASVGAPPMSVPHLDTRYINGKRALLFGPFATFSTKFLKYGSWTDLFHTMTFGNFIPMTEVGFRNFSLVSYLVGQVMMSEEQRVRSLKEYFPNASAKDWRLALAGQRVQIIKKDPQKGGILQFGTEVVSSKDGTITAILGASPGASTAVQAMLSVIERSFKDQLKTPKWQEKLKEMIPSYGQDLEKNEVLLRSYRDRNAKALQLKPAGAMLPDNVP